MIWNLKIHMTNIGIFFRKSNEPAYFFAQSVKEKKSAICLPMKQMYKTSVRIATNQAKKRIAKF